MTTAPPQGMNWIYSLQGMAMPCYEGGGPACVNTGTATNPLEMD